MLASVGRAGRTVLVTGAGREFGARVARRLAEDPAIARVIGVDTVPPRTAGANPLGAAEFVRADIRHPLIGKVLQQARVDTVVHVGFGRPELVPGEHLAGGLALLEAAAAVRSLTRFVATSSTGVYGASSSDPAVFAEDTTAVGELPAGEPRAAAAFESALRTFARDHADVTVTALRLAPLLGAGVDSALARYLALPVAPTELGFDPRLQVLHPFDAVEATVHLCGRRVPGAVNVAGAGVLTLAQALRVCGRPSLPLVRPALRIVPADIRPLLRFGRVVDISRLLGVGYLPRYTTAETLYGYVDACPGLPGLAGLAVAAVAGAQRLVASAS